MEEAKLFDREDPVALIRVMRKFVQVWPGKRYALTASQKAPPSLINNFIQSGDIFNAAIRKILASYQNSPETTLKLLVSDYARNLYSIASTEKVISNFLQDNPQHIWQNQDPGDIFFSINKISRRYRSYASLLHRFAMSINKKEQETMSKEISGSFSNFNGCGEEELMGLYVTGIDEIVGARRRRRVSPMQTRKVAPVRGPKPRVEIIEMEPYNIYAGRTSPAMAPVDPSLAMVLSQLDKGMDSVRSNTPATRWERGSAWPGNRGKYPY